MNFFMPVIQLVREGGVVIVHILIFHQKYSLSKAPLSAKKKKIFKKMVFLKISGSVNPQKLKYCRKYFVLLPIEDATHSKVLDN